MNTITYLGVQIHIDNSFLELKNLIKKEKQTCFLIDENVYKHWSDLFINDFVIIIPSGESQKSLSNVESIVVQLIENGLDRSSQLVGVGGGVVCDLTGFIASVFMRGIEFTLVPTTLLSMSDASIGGKNGVNTEKYKNMIGVINQPNSILCNISFLKTLPKDELINGMAEIIKHACICNSKFFDYIDLNSEEILSLNETILETLLTKSIKIKCNIVELDTNEKGDRKKLNFGHTYGHAVEKAYKIDHGKAVSLGIVIVNLIANQQNMLSFESSEKIKKLLEKIGLPTDIKFIDFDLLETYLKNDKKKNNKSIDMIFLEEIGVSKIVPVNFTEIQTFKKYFHESCN